MNSKPTGVFPNAQLNNGALVFLLLCVACAVVWSRLAVLWCAFRHGGRRGRRCRWRRLRSRCRGVGDAGPDSLQAPLLNPLQHEAPLPSALCVLFAQAQKGANTGWLPQCVWTVVCRASC